MIFNLPYWTRPRRILNLNTRSPPDQTLTEAEIAAIVAGVILGLVLIAGIRVIRPTHVGAIETLGRFTGFRRYGITYVFPFVQKLYKVNVTEQLVDVTRQDVITKDNLNCTVDAQVYFRVGKTGDGPPDMDLLKRVREEDLKAALYNVNDYYRQVVELARTTLRNEIGRKDFKEVNSDRASLNSAIHQSMTEETASWGIGIVRVELKEVKPPEDVQDAMNMVIKAENEKRAALDFATAAETKADGEKRAAIKIAEGEAKAITTVAEAKALEIEMVNDAADKHFTGNAQTWERLRVTESALKDGTKFVIAPDNQIPTIIVNETPATVIPGAPPKKPSVMDTPDAE